jgi:tetratricopeptide (TPR) repeat protein
MFIDPTLPANHPLRRAITAAGALLLCAACATPPSGPPPAPAETTAPPPAAAVAAPPPAKPAPPPAPRPPTAEERQRAEQLANESVKQLQEGDAAAGRNTLEQALALDPNNELARLMMRQVTADPVAELGATHFTYAIQRDDTLARLAQRFLNDRHLFYILARYNDIAQPNRIHVGQVIKIPGKAPPAEAPKPMAAVPPPAPAPAPAPVDDPTKKRLTEARELEKKGDLEGAMTAYADVLRRDPANAEAKQRSDEVRKRLIDRHYADGTAAFARQDLDKSIAAWGRVLELDPDHQNAKLQRQRALDLKQRLERFDSKK